MPTAAPIVTTSGLTKRYGSAPALEGVSLEVGAGEAFGLLGPNGAGKTTLIRAIAGLVTPDGGSVTVLGRRMPDIDVLARVGYMTQAPALYADLTVEENVRFFGRIHGVTGDVSEVLAFVDLASKRRAVVSTLSGGMRQRTSLACALVHGPALLLLDEPTVGVDPQLRVQLWDRFREMAERGTTIIVSSHVMDEAERCQRLGLVLGGRLLDEGSADELRARNGVASLEDAFLRLTRAAS